MGVTENKELGFKLQKRAAELGNIAAQISTAFNYLLEFGCTKDEEQAVFWFNKAIDQGAILAEYFLADNYREGKLLKRNLDKAVELFHDGADKGHLESMVMYGLYHLEGDNIQKGKEYLQQAAENGSALGQKCFAVQLKNEGDFEQNAKSCSSKFY